MPPDDDDLFRAHVFLGSGDGTFSGPVTTLSLPSSGILVDLNADGRADLVCRDRNQLQLYCGQPDGTFVAGDQVGTAIGTFALFPTDLDGDGGRDIAAFAQIPLVRLGIAFHRNRLVSLGEVIASMTIDPPVLQPKSRARWLHVTLELGAGHDVSEIDVGSLRILGAAPVERSAQTGDVDSDGIPDLTVAFPREPFHQLEAGDHVVTLTGHLVGGVSIQAQATIRILQTGGRIAVRVVSPVGASPVVFEISRAVERRSTVRVFDVRGRLVRAWGERDVLDRHVMWDGRTAKGADAPSGIYFTRVSTPSGEATVRTVLLR